MRVVRYIEIMIVGYGRKRDEAALREAGAEQVWLEEKPERPERKAMLEGLGLRSGDVLLLPDAAALASHWRERDAVLTALAVRGVAVQVLGGESVLYDMPRKLRAFKSQGIAAQNALNARRNRKPGPKPRFDPPAEKDAAVKAIWHSTDPWPLAAYRITEALKLEPEPIAMPSRDQLNRRYGPRFARQADRNEGDR